MKPRTTTNLDVFVMIGSILLTELMLILAMALRERFSIWTPLEPGANHIPLILYPLVGVIWFAMQFVFSTPRLVRDGQLIDGLWRLVAAVLLASLTFAGALFLSFRQTSRLYFIYFVLLDLIALLLFYGAMRLFVRRRVGKPQAQSRILIAGAGRTGLRLANALMRQWNGVAPVVGFIDSDPALLNQELEGWPVLGTLSDAEQLIEQLGIDEIIITLPLEAHPQTVELVRQLQAAPVHIRLVPDFLDFAIMRANVHYLEGLPIVGLRVPAISDKARIMKRLFDIVLSALLLLLLWPFLLIIALLIRRDSPGPALYRAERVGENGRIFQMYKFRTMVQDAETRWEEVAFRRADGKLNFKLPDDPRITRVGQWLRRTSLDELPQLLNVLKGDMSLVGPRPELPMVVREEYEPWQWSRFTVPQGMTGWWQVHRRGFEHQHLCTADDLYYIQNYSLMLDIRILMRTVLVVLGGQGAY
ncbi:MAG: sugar transferase [Chloroflexi bacterium SZAS-1]|jgi:exopolysaccharide biosynthesis polyprenyl glycosylphosphotransferase|nr:sugar transferase [Chloroflexi bacterium SZAS-1]HNP84800.1 sugar transferase [Kouleothrix sp.]